MSIIFSNSEFAIIDEKKFYNEIYREICVRIRDELFQIHGRFMPDSQFEAIQKCGGEDNRLKIQNTRKKIKRKLQENESEKTETINEVIKVAFDVQKIGWQIGCFSEKQQKDNNLAARFVAKRAETEFAKMSNFDSTHDAVRLGKTIEIGEKSAENQCFKISNKGATRNWYRNSAESKWIKTEHKNAEFLIPENCSFHIGNVLNVKQIVFNDSKFDLIVADPPWINRSVKRKKTYEMNENVLDQIQIDELLDMDNGILAIWVTNRSGIEDEVEKRLKTWNLKIHGIWRWLKMTTEGKPVYNFSQSSHKLPFETLILAKNVNNENFNRLPKKFLFASVPMAVHSHKPPIVELLQKFGHTFKRPLELFARSLLPHTTSIGFEPLFLQTENIFEKSK